MDARENTITSLRQTLRRILLAFAVVSAACALGATTASGSVDGGTGSTHLRNADEVARAMFPALNSFWQSWVNRWNIAYVPPPYYHWYNRPGLSWFSVPPGCDTYGARDGRMWGGYSPAYSPNSFYCPTNENFYLDWTFLQKIGWGNTRQFGPGYDARVALVMAHEFGHHVQHLLVGPERKRAQGEYANYELEADCFAGVFFAHGEDIGLMERGDTLNALIILGYLGDADRTPWNSPTRHGGHSDRQEWFNVGYQAANPYNCGKVFQ
jgi:hypothetical protein